MSRRGLWSFLVALALAAAGAEASETPKKEEAGKSDETTAAEAAQSQEVSDRYVHRWLPMPSFSAEGLAADSGPMTVRSRPGRMLVVLFLASYCEPCQQLIEDFIRLERRYRRLNTDFVYVFAHDTKDDASGFMKEFNMERGVLANYDALKAYHNPKLPTIYVGDRHGWLMTRYEEASKDDLAKLDELLQKLTAY